MVKHSIHDEPNAAIERGSVYEAARSQTGHQPPGVHQVDGDADPGQPLPQRAQVVIDAQTPPPAGTFVSLPCAADRHTKMRQAVEAGAAEAPCGCQEDLERFLFGIPGE